MHVHVHVTICDRPREKVPYVGKNVFSDYGGFRIYRSVHVFAANLGHIGRFVAEIQVFFHPEQRKLHSPKRQFLYASNFSVYASVTRCVYSDPHPLGFVATRDVGQGKEVTAR